MTDTKKPIENNKSKITREELLSQVSESVNDTLSTLQLAEDAISNTSKNDFDMCELLNSKGFSSQVIDTIFKELNSDKNNELQHAFNNQRKQSKMIKPSSCEQNQKPRRPTKMRGIVI